MKQRRVLPLTLGYERRLPKGFPEFDGISPLWWEGGRGDETARTEVALAEQNDPYWEDVIHPPVANIITTMGGPLVALSGQFGLPSGAGRGERHEFIYDEMKRLVSDIWEGRIPLYEGQAALDSIIERNTAS